jgi:hypothetical protein
MNCPCCLFAGTLQEVRAHVVVQVRIDDDHATWVAEQGIDLDDDTQASVGELTHALSRSEQPGTRIE